MNRIAMLVAIFVVSACSGGSTKDKNTAECGNGSVEAGEECDGSALAGESCEGLGLGTGELSCDSSCELVTDGCSDEAAGECGDGAVEGDEECDGSELDGTTCSELGFGGGDLSCTDACAFDTSACEAAPGCGDGEIAGAEECDGAALGGQDCASLGMGTGALACNANCTFDTAACMSGPSCGNGTIEFPEQCEGADLGGETCITRAFDGGTLACSSSCSFDESACFDAVCGNDAVEGAEQCDGTDLANSTCASLGLGGGSLDCTPGCRFDVTACTNMAVCANGAVEFPEDCDGGDLNNTSCLDLGFLGGTLACDGSCVFDTSACTGATCGNGMAEGGELCDGADLRNNDCVDLGFDGGNLACDGSCDWDTSACFGCGDGTLDAGEMCDGANLDNEDCMSRGFDAGTLACAMDCSFDETACRDFVCGDGMIEGTEQCDVGDLGGQTCLGLSLPDGMLGCSGSCMYDTTMCTGGPSLTVTSGVGQTARVNELLSMDLVVTYTDGGTPMAGVAVTVTGDPGLTITPAAATTDANGQLAATVRLGRALGDYTVIFSTAGLPDATASVTAIAPAPGTIYSVYKVSDEFPLTPRDLATATDGTLYVLDAHPNTRTIKRVDPVGEVTIVAGGGADATSENIPATDARFMPAGMAFDEAAGRIYISDSDTDTVRMVDLSTGLISTYAGGGTATVDPYGDGGPATAATLGQPRRLALDPSSGGLYIAETLSARARIRYVDPTTSTISTVPGSEILLQFSPTCDLARLSCGVSECPMAVDAGRLFVGGTTCRQNQGFGAVFRSDLSGSWEVAFGGPGATLPPDGTAALQYSFSRVYSLAHDSGGNLYAGVAEPIAAGSAGAVVRIDANSTAVTRIAGNGTSGTAGDYGPATSAETWPPSGLALHQDGTIAVSTTSAPTQVREIWQFVDPVPSVVSFTPSTSDTSAELAAPFALSALLQVDGTVVEGYPIDWQRLAADGSGLITTASLTDVNGIASTDGRVGLAPATVHSFEASFTDLSGQRLTNTFDVTAGAPAPGIIFTAMNTADRISVPPGPGPLTDLFNPQALEARSDGTVYFGTRVVPASAPAHYIIGELSPGGEITVLAGGGTDTGDDVDGLSASIQVFELALDEGNERLYFLESQTGPFPPYDIRYLDLNTGRVDTWVAVPFGQGINDLAVVTSGDVFFASSASGTGGISRVNAVDRSVDQYVLPYATGSMGTNPCTTAGVGAVGSVRVMTARDDWVYVGGSVCQTATALGNGTGVSRFNATTLSYEHLAGLDTGMDADGIAPTLAVLDFINAIGVGPTGAVYISELNSMDLWGARIRRIDNIISTVAGTGNAASTGDYGPAVNADVLTATDLVVLPGEHVMFSEHTGLPNWAVRVVY